MHVFMTQQVNDPYARMFFYGLTAKTFLLQLSESGRRKISNANSLVKNIMLLILKRLSLFCSSQ